MNWLSHPLLGRDPYLTGGALVLLGVLVAGSLVQYVLSAHVFVEDRMLGWTWLYDGFLGVLIIAIGVSWFLAIAYGWANGGAVLAPAIALVPSLLATAVRFELVVTADLAVAFAAGTLAVWLAAWSAYGPVDATPGTDLVAALAAGVTGAAAVVVWRAWDAAGPHAVEGMVLAWVLIGLGTFSGVVWAIAHWRAT